MNENNGKNIIEEKKDSVASSNTLVKNSSVLRKKLIKLMMIIGVAVIVIVIVMIVIGLFKSKNLKYEEIEEKMKTAAIEYYKVQKSLLPEEGATAEVDASVLSSTEHMKPLSQLKKDVSCKGKVVVQKIDGKYIYTPYLNCGKEYSTKKLYEEVNKNIVTSGDGLYEMNGQLVFRGEKVNNYVQLDKYLFQIVKLTADQEILIIPVLEKSGITYHWDNRYNVSRSYNAGINNYRISRIYDKLQTLYNSEENEWLSENDKEKLTTFSLCIGKRNIKDENNSNSVECSDILENQMIGLLTVSDYVNASIDSNCRKPSNKACQNYNYLKVGTNWWTVTAEANNDYQVLYVNQSGYVEETGASNPKSLRPVFMLSNQTFVKSGDGTKDHPYILK